VTGSGANGQARLSSVLHESRLSLVASDAFAFLAGAVAFVEVQVVGRLYVGELILLICGLGLPLLYGRLRTRRERRLLAWFFLLAVMYLLALIAADLYRSTPFTDYARGWARAFVYCGDLGGLLVLGYRRPRRLILFVAGTGLSQLALGVLGLWPTDWKFGYAYPITVGVLALIDSRKRLLASAVLVALGLVHLLLDYRMFGGLCVMTAVLAYARETRKGARIRVRNVAVTAITVVAFVQLYVSGLGLDRGYDVLVRRLGSNVERLAGFVVASQLIRQSPVVGYGSWARSDEALENWATLQAELGSPRTATDLEQEALLSPEASVVRAHSMVLQAWVEAGVVGLVFFGFSLLVTVMMLYRITVRSGPLRHYALVVFFGMWNVWALVMSPFAGVSRLYTATSFALLFIFSRDAA